MEMMKEEDIILQERKNTGTSWTNYHSFEKNGYFDINMKNGQDYEMWLKMSNDVNLHIIKEFLGNYIEEKKSITLRPFRKRFFNSQKHLRHKTPTKKCKYPL